MRKIFFLQILWTFRLCADPTGLFDLEAEGLEQYQDIYVRGSVVKKASYQERFLEDRFAIVDSILKRYKRPFTLLDIGAAQGYFSIRGAEKYPKSVFVMLEGSNPVHPKISQQLASICELNRHLLNLIWLDSPIILKDLENLSLCEHFDVSLLLNIVHWFPKEWKDIIDAVCLMSQVVVVEVPPVEETLPTDQLQLRREIHRYLSALAKQTIQGVPRHTNPSLYTTYYIVENEGPFALQKTSLIHPYFEDRVHRITCNYEIKQFEKIDREAPFLRYVTDWQPGINLITYLMLKGSYPKRQEVISSLPETNSHKDWMLNNMILQGEGIVLVDENDQKNEEGGVGVNLYTPQLRKKVEQLILMKDPDPFKTAFFTLWEN